MWRILLIFLPLSLLAQPWSSNARRIQSRDVCSDAPADTQVLRWSAARACWEPNVGGAGTGTVNTGTAGYLSYYPATGTLVDDLDRTFYDGASGKFQFKNGAGVVKAEIDTATGLWVEGLGTATGLARSIGNAGDTDRSSLTIYGGDAAANAEPAYFRLYGSSGGINSFLYPCNASGRMCIASAAPAADSTDFLLSAANTVTIQNKTLDNTNPFSGFTDRTEIATPAAPAAGSLRITAQTAGHCWKDSGGNEVCIGSTVSTGAGTPTWGTNCPAVNCTTPFTWIVAKVGANVVYIPVFK